MLKGRVISIFFLVMLGATGLGYVLGYWAMVIPVAVLFVFFVAKMYGSFFISSNFYLRTFCSGNRNSNAISITFDDGPDPQGTDRVLNILRERNVKATFFCIGKNVTAAESLLKQIDLDGHLIGNHTFHHGKWFDLQSPEKMLKELQMTDEAIFHAIRKKPKFFRPPYGVTNPNLARAVREEYQTIGWSVRSFDTVTLDSDKLWHRIAGKIKGGDIVLFHDRCEATIEMLPKFIDFVTETGLRIVPLDQLLNLKPYA